MEEKNLSPKRGNLEQKLQIAVTSYIDAAFPDIVYFHPPNEGKRSKIMGRLLKLMGMDPGVSDCIFSWPDGKGAIELKRPDKPKKLSPTQEVFAAKWVANGGKFACCQNMDEVEATLKSWGLTTRYKTPPLEKSGRNMLMQVSQWEMYRRD